MNISEYSGPDNTSKMTITQSEIAGGMADYGAGIENALNADLTVAYSTIADNTATYYGGGLLQWSETGTVSLDHVTMTDNYSDSTLGYDIAQYIDSGTALPVVVTNSIIFGTNACYGYLDASSEYNIFEFDNPVTCSVSIWPTGSNLVLMAGAVKLSQLGTFGGKYPVPYRGTLANTYTRTYALGQGSSAIDYLHCTVSTEDQRGFPVPVDAGIFEEECDVGAYERQVFNFLSFLKKP